MRTGSVSGSGAGEMAETSPVSECFTCAAEIIGLIFQYPTICIFVCACTSLRVLYLFLAEELHVQRNLIIHPFDKVTPKHQSQSSPAFNHNKALQTCSSFIFFLLYECRSGEEVCVVKVSAPLLPI